jgi:catechol 2,3-dioxygenase-like lactoylglutathione lyase family enzyme
MSRKPQDPAQPQVFGLHHAAFRCRDAAETTAFYDGILGFPLSQALEIDRHPTTGKPVHYMHIFFDIGSHDPAAPNYIAFFEVQDHPGDTFEFKTQWGMDLHFAMGVRDHADLARWQERLAARGVKVEGPIDHGMCTSIYFHDPNGYRLEFSAQNDAERAHFDASKLQARKVLSRWSGWKAERHARAALAKVG